MRKYSSIKGFFNFFILIAPFWLAGCKTDNNHENTWAEYKADANSSSYSSLDQINISNVSQLESAWTFQMHDLAPGADAVSSQSNPIIVDVLGIHVEIIGIATTYIFF